MNKSIRFIIYDPKSDTYVKIRNGGWSSGHAAEAVNSYDSLEDALRDVKPFNSLRNCQIVEVLKTIEVIS